MSDVQTEGDVSAQLKKIAEHLVFLEKKLDTLLEARNSRPSFDRDRGPRRFDRHENRPQGGGYGPKPHHGTRTAYYGPGGGNRPEGGRPYGRPNRFQRPGQGGHGQGHKKFSPNRHSRHE